MDGRVRGSIPEYQDTHREPPVLQRHEPNDVLTVYLGATSYAISAVLVKNEGKEEKPVYFISNTLSLAEKNCTRLKVLESFAFKLQSSIEDFISEL